MSEGDRPQDAGRRHRRAAGVAPETIEILERYRRALRRDLGALLDELEPGELVQASIDGSADRVVGLAPAARRERWDLAIRLARELAGGSDQELEAPPIEPARRAGGAPKLSARDRRALGVE